MTQQLLNSTAALLLSALGQNVSGDKQNKVTGARGGACEGLWILWEECGRCAGIKTPKNVPDVLVNITAALVPDDQSLQTNAIRF